MTLSTYTLEEYLKYEGVEPQLEELIIDRIEELEEVQESIDSFEGKLSNIEGEIDDTLQKLYHQPKRDWEEHSLLKDMYSPTERVEILLAALQKIKGII